MNKLLSENNVTFSCDVQKREEAQALIKNKINVERNAIEFSVAFAVDLIIAMK